jgi:hypothetical protein
LDKRRTVRSTRAEKNSARTAGQVAGEPERRHYAFFRSGVRSGRARIDGPRRPPASQPCVKTARQRAAAQESALVADAGGSYSGPSAFNYSQGALLMQPTTVSIVAGLIANGLPEVADAVVDKGVDYVQDKLGVELKPEGQMTHEEIARLREAAMKHEEFMAEVDEKSRQRASDMQVHAMDNNDPFVRRFIYYFAWFWSSISIVYFFAVTFIEIPPSGQNTANTILGFLLGTAVSAILQFFYGSSKSSMDKTNAMMRVQQR